MLPAAEDFIREVRDIYSRVDTPEERFKEIQPHLEKLLQDEELREVSKTWPFRNEPERGYIENLLFYEDPDYGFVLNSLLKKPRESRRVPKSVGQLGGFPIDFSSRLLGFHSRIPLLELFPEGAIKNAGSGLQHQMSTGL